ncbi:MAG: hypothetical protein IJE19_03325 [Clostridia bacterium]|nr:hypothetical protein [Clostridia bacterium]
MNRKETTKFLSELLIRRKLTGMGKYYASEVTLDYGKGKGKEKRVDFMQFVPQNQISISGIEKGIFICYEIKSCKADFDSGWGLNFEGEQNYIVTTMEAYKAIIKDQFLPFGIGCLVACPMFRTVEDEFEAPSDISDDSLIWDLRAIVPSHKQDRKRPMAELLFCMLRAGK